MSADLTIRALGGAEPAAETALPSQPFRTKKTPDAGEKFEAFVLQTMIQNMMPKDSEHVFGSGVSGDFWRSMMSEKIAEQVASRGNLGIAELVREGRSATPRPDIPLDVLTKISTLGDVTATLADAKSGD